MTRLITFVVLSVIVGLAFFHRVNIASAVYWGSMAGAVCATLVHFTAMAQARRRRIAELSAMLRETLPKREEYD